jgi:hypothetical protein
LNCPLSFYEIIRVGVLQFFIAAHFVNLAVSLPQYQFASHTRCLNDFRRMRRAQLQAGTAAFAAVEWNGYGEPQIVLPRLSQGLR